MESKLISVVIPCYNAGEYVREAIESVKKQSIYSQLEIIVVNDGSNDQMTKEVLINLENDGIQIVHQKNLGLSEARNSGIRIAQGEYICCLDSDDKIKSTYLEKAVKLFQENKRANLGIVTSWVQCFGASDELWKPVPYDPILLLTNNVLTVASVFRKDIWETVGGYKSGMNGSSVDGKLGGYEDWEYWISIIERGFIWKVIEEPLLLYRRTPNSMISHSAAKHDELYARIIEFHKDYFEKNHTEIIKKLMEKVNYLQQILAEKEKNELKFLGIGPSAIARIKCNPKKLLEVNSYKKIGKRIFKRR